MRILPKKEEWLMKYAQRYHIIQQTIEGLIPSKEAAQILNISLRYLKRLKKKAKELDPKALKSKIQVQEFFLLENTSELF